MGNIVASINIEVPIGSDRDSLITWIQNDLHNNKNIPSSIDYDSIKLIPSSTYPEDLRIELLINSNSFARAKKDVEDFIKNIESRVFEPHSSEYIAEISGQTLMAAA